MGILDMIPKAKPKMPYIRLYKTVDGGIKVYIVDGSYVRSEIDEQFTNFGQHYRFKYIPHDEFWLDKQHGVDEYNYYIGHLLIEYNDMRKGRSYDTALVEADKIEKAMRKGSKVVAINERVYKEVNGVRICLVNGEAVRNKYNIDFTEGGHDLVYKWMPAKTIWIDDALMDKEREVVLLHEIGERNLMSKGVGYNSAHNKISKVEQKVRKKPELMGKVMRDEYKALGKIR